MKRAGGGQAKAVFWKLAVEERGVALWAEATESGVRSAFYASRSLLSQVKWHPGDACGSGNFQKFFSSSLPSCTKPQRVAGPCILPSSTTHLSLLPSLHYSLSLSPSLFHLAQPQKKKPRKYSLTQINWGKIMNKDSNLRSVSVFIL